MTSQAATLWSDLLLRAIAAYVGTLPGLGLHAMTVGGIGLITAGLMSMAFMGFAGLVAS